jgi:cysteine synthase A
LEPARGGTKPPEIWLIAGLLWVFTEREIQMPRGQAFQDVTKTIGNTPMIRINRLVPADQATVFAKCEFFQPLNSVKDRIGVAMIEAGEQSGKLKSDTHVIEPTSGQ